MKAFLRLMKLAINKKWSEEEKGIPVSQDFSSMYSFIGYQLNQNLND